MTRILSSSTFAGETVASTASNVLIPHAPVFPSRPIKRDSVNPFALVARLVQLEARVAALEQADQTANRRSDHSAERHSDARQRLAAILPVVAATFGSDLFLVSELFQSSAPALMFILQHETRRELGQLFARFVDQPIGDFVVKRCGHEHKVAVWMIERLV
jgi:hypothetical protein